MTKFFFADTSLPVSFYLENRASYCETEAIFGLGALDKHVYGVSGGKFFFADSSLPVSLYLGNRASYTKTEAIFGLDALDKHVDGGILGRKDPWWQIFFADSSLPFVSSRKLCVVEQMEPPETLDSS